MTDTNTAPRAKLWDLLTDIKVAMLVTNDDNVLRGRPMLSHPDRDAGVIWFLTGKSDPKISEIQDDREVNLSFMDVEHSHFVSVSGRASITRDRQVLDRIWSDYEAAWFPDGKDDPQLAMLKIIPEQAEYWDTERRTMLPASEFVEAARTGTMDELTDNKKITQT